VARPLGDQRQHQQAQLAVVEEAPGVAAPVTVPAVAVAVVVPVLVMVMLVALGPGRSFAALVTGTFVAVAARGVPVFGVPVFGVPVFGVAVFGVAVFGVAAVRLVAGLAGSTASAVAIAVSHG